MRFPLKESVDDLKAVVGCGLVCYNLDGGRK